jgi:hypothetical protein
LEKQYAWANRLLWAWAATGGVLLAYVATLA